MISSRVTRGPFVELRQRQRDSGRDRVLVSSLSYKDADPVLGSQLGTSSEPHALPKAPSAHTVPPEVGASADASGRDTPVLSTRSGHADPRDKRKSRRAGPACTPRDVTARPRGRVLP